MVGDDHFGEFGQGFFQLLSVVPQIWSLLWFVVSRLVIVSMYVWKPLCWMLLYGRCRPPM